MRVRRLKIKGFRNLKEIVLELDEATPIHAFVGPNGQGKTNILEAIYVCSLSKSFRTRVNADLVGFDADFASVKLSMDEETLEVIVTAKPPQKALKINGVKKTAPDFVGRLKAVFFSPDDLAYMSQAPKLRRRYLDVMLSQLNQTYLRRLMEFNEAVRQRNSLLKAIADGRSGEDELEFWDTKLAELGSYLGGERGRLIQELQPLVEGHYRAISTSEAALKIIYSSEVRGVSPSEMKQLYRESRPRDLIVCQTRLGPHRDDLQFLLNDRDMAFFASRGEWRSMVLALKFAEIDLIKNQTGDRPILLLDDVFSELDADRQKYLFDATGESQTFLTTTHKEFIEALPAAHRIYEVSAGAIASEPA